jgi:hypothetical protein
MIECDFCGQETRLVNGHCGACGREYYDDVKASLPTKNKTKTDEAFERRREFGKRNLWFGN